MISREQLRPFLSTALGATHLEGLGELYKGKVRDVYHQPKHQRSILVATDRQSAFDIDWCTVPLKGQILTSISNQWFTDTADILPNHILATPDPNAAVVKHLTMFPLEIVVRGFLTGSAKTSIWMNYQKGQREFNGMTLPSGLAKNTAFVEPLLTPTTKGESDDPITGAEIVTQGIATTEQWNAIQEAAFALFQRGQEIARSRGLILVDTKYEMGLDADGVLTLADEVHTPDSSRYWIADTYEQRIAEGEEPEYLDKEFFRLWLRERGFEYGGYRPEITDEARLDLSLRYIELYERVTGSTFTPPESTDIETRLAHNLASYASN